MMENTDSIKSQNVLYIMILIIEIYAPAPDTS